MQVEEKKKKHYDLRLRDPDDAEQLKQRTCNGRMEM